VIVKSGCIQNGSSRRTQITWLISLLLVFVCSSAAAKSADEVIRSIGYEVDAIKYDLANIVERQNSNWKLDRGTHSDFSERVEKLSKKISKVSSGKFGPIKKGRDKLSQSKKFVAKLSALLKKKKVTIGALCKSAGVRFAASASADKATPQEPGDTPAEVEPVSVEDAPVEDTPIKTTPTPKPDETDLDGLLSKVDQDKAAQREYQKKLKKTWLKVSKLARNKKIPVKTKVKALEMFLAEYPEKNPYQEKTRLLMRNINPATIAVQTEPKGAFVIIVGAKGGKAPFKRKIKSGTYKLKASLAGHLPAEKTVAIEPGQEVKVDLVLSRKPSMLTVTTKPVGAFVFIDGEEAGPSPVMKQLTANSCEVKAFMEHYQTVQGKVKLKPGGKAKVFLALKRGLGTLMISSQPKGAQLWINAKKYLPTPLTKKMPAGLYKITASLEGYVKQEKTVVVKHGEKTQVSLTMKEPPPGSLIITSQPVGARVWIDGKEVGVTPLTKPAEPGFHKVAVQKSGYHKQEKQAESMTGQNRKVSFILEAKPPGTLSVTTAPAKAEVFLDGKPIGRTPKTLEVVEGPHEISATLKGYTKAVQKVEIVSGQKSAVAFALEKQALGTLVVISEPSGAKVLLNGKDVGKAPFTKSIKSGEYEIVASMKDYLDEKKAVEVWNGETTEVVLRMGKVARGGLTIKTEPEGVAVFVDGLEIGKGPVTKQLKAGKYEVSASHGKAKVKKQVTVFEGEKNTIVLSFLDKIDGTLTINSKPKGATIYIDGEKVGRAPVTQTLPPGRHKIKASLAGCYDNDTDAKVVGTKSEDVTVKLDVIVQMAPLNKWGHAAFWSGLSLAAFGSVSAVLAWKYAEDFKEKSWDTSADDNSRMWSGLMYTGLIGGGALMIAGTVLWILSPDDQSWSESRFTSAGAAPTLDGQGLVFTLGGRW